MATRIEKVSDSMSTRLRYIENRTKELERLLADQAFEQGAKPSVQAGSVVPPAAPEMADESQTVIGPGVEWPGEYPPDEPADTAQDEEPGAPSDARTEKLIRYGRAAGQGARRVKPRTIAIIIAVVAVLTGITKLTLFSGGPSWPSSVAVVRDEIAKACQNPDVVSEPGQVNFACAKNTQQVLWVLSLLTSRNDPQFKSGGTGREGLEPIAPSQGGEVAWSLNLHQPYNPFDPIDSLEVAARAVNNIVGGATVIGSDGKSVVEPGLESNAANCARYTGSAAVISRAGYPSMCALPVTSISGQGALVTDIYKQWVVGASDVAAQDAGVLFENSNDPGNAQVQAILTNPPASGL